VGGGASTEGLLWAVRGDRRGLCPDGEEANSEDGEEAAVMGKKHGGYVSGELFAILELRRGGFSQIGLMSRTSPE
jgi:hypothetical protein